MRIKKGFTLAEILIVLMVIGVIATMTIPGLMSGVQEATFKTALKKSYNIIVNLAAIGRVSGDLPAKATSYPDFMLFMGRNLSAKGFIDAPINGGSVVKLNDMKAGLKVKKTTSSGDEYEYAGSQEGDTLDLRDAAPGATETSWIVTEDGFAYTAVQGGSGDTDPCGTTLDINAKPNVTEAITRACFVVIVDVNGIQKLPNILEPQILSDRVTNADNKLEALSGDQYYILVGRDGATSGNTQLTLTGRIIGDVK